MSTDPITITTKTKKTKKTKTVTRASTATTTAAGNSPANAALVPGAPKILEANYQDEPTGLGYLDLKLNPQKNLTFYTAYYEFNTVDVITVFWNGKFIDEFIAGKNGHDAIPRLITAETFTIDYDPGYYKLQYSIVPTPNPSKKKSTKKQAPIYSLEADIFVKTSIPGDPDDPTLDPNNPNNRNPKLKDPIFTPNPVLESTDDLICTIPKWPNQSAYDTVTIKVGPYSQSVNVNDATKDVTITITDVRSKVPAGRVDVTYSIIDWARNYSFNSPITTLDMDYGAGAPPRPDFIIDGEPADTVNLSLIAIDTPITVAVNYFDGLERGQQVVMEVYGWKANGEKVEFRSPAKTVGDPHAGLEFEIPYNTVNELQNREIRAAYIIGKQLSRIKVAEVKHGPYKAPHLTEYEGDELDFIDYLERNGNRSLEIIIPPNPNTRYWHDVEFIATGSNYEEYRFKPFLINHGTFTIPYLLAASTDKEFDFKIRYELGSIRSEVRTYKVLATRPDHPVLSEAEVEFEDGKCHVRCNVLNEATFSGFNAHFSIGNTHWWTPALPHLSEKLDALIPDNWIEQFKGNTVIITIAALRGTRTVSYAPPRTVTL